MGQFTIKEGDTRPTFEYKLTRNRAPLGLGEASEVRLYIADSGDGTLYVNTAVDIVDSANGEVAYTFTQNDVLPTGDHYAEFVVTYTDGSTQTVPNGGYVNISVNEPLDRNMDPAQADEPNLTVTTLTAEDVTATNSMTLNGNSVSTQPWVNTQISDHEALSNPHSGSAAESWVNTQIGDHEALSNPHSGSASETWVSNNFNNYSFSENYGDLSGRSHGNEDHDVNFASQGWVDSNYTTPSYVDIHVDNHVGEQRYYEINSGSAEEYFKLVTLKNKGSGTNGGGAANFKLNFSEDRGGSPTRTVELFVFAKGSNFNAEYTDNGQYTRSQDSEQLDLLITEDPGDGSDTDHQYHVYVRAATYTAAGVTVTPAQWFGSHDWQAKLDSTELTGSIVYDTQSQSPDRVMRVGDVTAHGPVTANGQLTANSGLESNGPIDTDGTINTPAGSNMYVNLYGSGSNDVFSVYDRDGMRDLFVVRQDTSAQLYGSLTAENYSGTTDGASGGLNIGPVNYSEYNGAARIYNTNSSPEWAFRYDGSSGWTNAFLANPDGYGNPGGISNLSGTTGNFDGEERLDDGTNTPARGTKCVWDDVNGVWVPQHDPTQSFT